MSVPSTSEKGKAASQEESPGEQSPAADDFPEAEDSEEPVEDKGNVSLLGGSGNKELEPLKIK